MMPKKNISKYNQLTLRKFLSLLLTVAMLVLSLPAAAYATLSDVQGHWGQTAIEKWSGLGIVRGADGAFRPDDPITRGEMAVIIDNVMHYQTKAENRFSDLGQAFYTDAILKANAAGVINGDGTAVSPADKITREEAAVMLGRALGLRENAAGSGVFSDAAEISSWAAGYINAMAGAGYVQGSNGQFNPKDSITRAEVVTILNSSIKQLYNENKEYNGNVSGTAIVNISGVVLKDMEISGDLIIAEGVGNGDLTLNNVKVVGNTLVRGGGPASIHIQGGSQISHLIMEKTDDGAIRIVTSEGAVVEAVFVDDGTDDIIMTGSFASITVAADVAVKAVDARIGQVDVTAGDAVLDVNQDSVIGTLNVAETAADTKVTISGKVEKLTANAKVSIENKGTITQAQINANGVAIEGNAPATVNVAATVTDTPAASSSLTSGKTSSGGGGGSSSKKETDGILVVAHGSSEDAWNQPVRDAVEAIDSRYPVELGFLEYVAGEDIGTAVANLEKRGAKHIITVPIFVASASGHIEEIKYMLGLPTTITEEEANDAGLKVIPHNALIEITPAMDDHQLVAEILDDRIATVSRQADQEIVVLAAHGTSAAADLTVWENNLASLGRQLEQNYNFLDVDYGFAAQGEPKLRAVVEAQQSKNSGASIIVMPVMLSEGTLTDSEIPEVLAGLTYVYPAKGQRSLLPHNNISKLIVARAYEALSGVFAGGNGTESDPYQVATAVQLNAARNNLSASYILTADIDLSGYENWTPIGTLDENIFGNGGHSDIAFSGTFDGNGHTVSNLTAIHQDLAGVGLFGAASSDAVIKNLTVENATVTGYMSTAGIIGLNCASVENLTLKGENTISSINCTGGILGGHGYGSIKNCTVEDVTIRVLGDNDFSGGRIIQCDVAECGGLIVGGAFTGTIANCKAKGEVIAEGNEPVGLGGIGGCLEYMESITGCTADVTITAPNTAHAVGGLCGYAGTGDIENPAVIENCSVKFVMNTANATHIGGLVGTGLYYMGLETVFSIGNCSAEGQINGAVTPGTIAGRAENCTIADCTSDVLIDGVKGMNEIGTTDRMYESADQ